MNRSLLLLIAGVLVAILLITPAHLRSAQEEPTTRFSQPEWNPASPADRTRFPQDTSDRLRMPEELGEVLQIEQSQEDKASLFENTDQSALPLETFPLESEEPTLETDLTGLIAMAQSNSPSLRKLQSRVEQARGYQHQALLRPNPTVGYQAQEVGNDGALGQHGVYWSQRWVRGGKLELSSEVWNWEAERRGWEFQVERYRIANLVRQRYYNLLAARRVLQITELILGIATRNLGVVEDLFEAGEVARNDLLQAKIEMQQSELRRDNATISIKQSEQLLALSLALPEMDSRDIQGDILADIPELTIDEVRNWLDEESPELEVARSEIERAKWKVERESAEPIPDITTQAGVMYDDSTNDAAGSFQVSWQIPKNNGNQGNIAAARADLMRAQHEQTELLLRLSTRVQTAFQQYELSRNKVRVYETRVLRTAKENLEVTREAYRVGEANYQTLLIAQRSYFDASLALIEARRLLWLSVARIQSLVIPE